MTIEHLVNLYEAGVITAHHAAVEAVNLITASNADHVMRLMPDKVRLEIEQFVQQFRPGEMKTNYGQIPAAENVQAIKEWLARARS